MIVFPSTISCDPYVLPLCVCRPPLHDGARDAAARTVVGAEALALGALGLDDGAGGCGDRGCGGGRHFVWL
jgi:hypothetical protein